MYTVIPKLRTLYNNFIYYFPQPTANTEDKTMQPVNFPVTNEMLP